MCKSIHVSVYMYICILYVYYIHAYVYMYVYVYVRVYHSNLFMYSIRDHLNVVPKNQILLKFILIHSCVIHNIYICVYSCIMKR